jgi:hypothetical protein
MLTTKERKAVVACLRNYPAGIPEDSWGYGPLLGTLSIHLRQISTRKINKYG